MKVRRQPVDASLPVDWNRLPWEAVRDGVERKLCNGVQATMAMHRVSAAAVTAEHAHPEEQIVYVVSGRLRYSVEEKTHVMEPGDVLLIPANVMHRAQTISDEPAVTLDVFSPRRTY